MFSFIREELYMLHANLQGLQAAARQLLFHAGQRKLPGFPSARPLLLLAPSRQPASVRGPLHPHSQPPAELRLQLLPQLHQRPPSWYDLYSGVKQVMWEKKNHSFRRKYSECSCDGCWQTSFMCFFFSVLYFLGYPAEEITGRSWYGLVHPEDLSLSADSHRSLSKFTAQCIWNQLNA